MGILNKVVHYNSVKNKLPPPDKLKKKLELEQIQNENTNAVEEVQIVKPGMIGGQFKKKKIDHR